MANSMDDEPIETTSEFLSTLSETLKAQQDFDDDLASLIAKHLLTSTPNEECVNHAFAAMTELASSRAREGSNE
jgi:hypothetical protein